MKTYLCQAIVTVEDEDALVGYADERVQECWADSLRSMLEKNETLVERALAEALFASNENPNPADYGIAFQEIRVQYISDTRTGRS